MAAKHQNTYNLKAHWQTIRGILISPAFASKLNVEMKSENPTETGVWFRFHHGVTFTSWGEKITITLTPLGEMLTQVQILSECGMPTQIADWGKNKQNVCNIYEYLEAEVARAPQPTTPQYAPQPAAEVVEPAQPTPPAQPLMMPRFCPMCGQPVATPSKFCSQCGAKLMP